MWVGAGNLVLEQEMVLLESVNGQEMKKLLNNTWLRDKPVLIQAEMTFGDVRFHADVGVEVSPSVGSQLLLPNPEKFPTTGLL